MIRQRSLAFTLAYICLTGYLLPSLHSQGTSTIENYEQQPVSAIDVTMENLPQGASFDPKIILSRLKTKIGDPFSQLTFDSDLKTLAKEYDRVEPSVEMENGAVRISLKIWARPMIRSIHWEGNKKINTSTLKDELGIKKHTIFNRQAFTKAFNKVKEYYIKKGYFEAEIYYTTEIDPKTNEVDIAITIKEGRSGRVDEIVFKGFTDKETSKILEMIYTKKYNFFLSWMTGTGIYNEEVLEHDKLTIVNFLQNHGYADAKVDIRIVDSATDGKVKVEIIADRGPIYRFGQVRFDGNTLFSDQEIENRFLVHPGDTYSPEKLKETSQAIKEMYGRRGRIDANVQYETSLVESEPLYNAYFQIEEGQEYKIGLIRIFGNVQTKSNVILRESLLIPGDTFDAAKLKATQMRLENIGYFKTVNVYAVRTPDDETLGENYRDVYIEVEETTTGNISLFFGFSSADDIFGGLDLTEANFNYKGFGKLFSQGASAVRGGGEYAHARISLGARERSYLISWLNPYFRDTLWRVGFDVTRTHSELQSKDYEINTTGFSLNASYPLTAFWTFGTKYRFRNSQTHFLHGISKDDQKEEGSDGIISALGASLVFDSTDSHIKPHNGFRSIIESEFAGLGGEFTFLRFGYVNTLYTKIWRYGVMKYRADFRFIEPLANTNHPHDIPMSERFYLGGETTVRGYKAFDIGPHFPNGSPIGGISSSLFSMEYNQEVFRFLDLFAFIDGGMVSFRRFHLSNYKFSWGFGTRVEVMNRVPLTIGIGFPVNPDRKNQIQRFFFSMRGQF